MARVFVAADSITEDSLSLAGSQARHLRTVMRLQPGDTFGAVDDTGREHTVRITYLSSELLRGAIIESHEVDTEPRARLTVLQAMPKGRNMALVIQKCTELGVARIAPMVTERVVVRLEQAKADKRRERWQRIAFEAARQCGRTVVPEVTSVAPFPEALRIAAEDDMALILSEHGPARALDEVIKSGLRVDSLSLAVGPEGGFSQRELELALEAGLLAVSLGPRILRTETAAIAATAVCLYALGEMGDT
ncbi:MAG: 16S rRNA (uracil(1498)-N(3))-methyltransferase [Armatimonadota bacterium]